MVDTLPRITQPVMLSISSSPSRAEIYIDKKPGKRISPDAYTPAILKNFKTNPLQLTLFKKGYSDTTFVLNAASDATKSIEIFMSPLHVDSLRSQNLFFQERYHAQLGRLCFISSPLFAAAGAGLLYYSEKNRKKADEAKSFIDRTIIPSGPEFNDMEKQYTNETKKRNTRFIAGLVMFGLAAIDIGAGFVLYF